MEHFKQELVEYLDYYNNRRIKAKLKGLPPAWDAGHRETVRSMQMARPERRCTPEDRRILSWAAQAALPRPRMESGKENVPARFNAPGRKQLWAVLEKALCVSAGVFVSRAGRPR